jgi:hypothetical protein
MKNHTWWWHYCWGTVDAVLIGLLLGLRTPGSSPPESMFVCAVCAWLTFEGLLHLVSVALKQFRGDE